MDIKRFFGALLTLLGIAGLIYGATIFVNTLGGTHNIKAPIMFSIIGIIFFVAGIGLIRTVKDES